MDPPLSWRTVSPGPGKGFAGGSEAALPRGARAPRWSDEPEPRAARSLGAAGARAPASPGLALPAAALGPEAPVWRDT